MSYQYIKYRKLAIVVDNNQPHSENTPNDKGVNDITQPAPEGKAQLNKEPKTHHSAVNKPVQSTPHKSIWRWVLLLGVIIAMIAGYLIWQKMTASAEPRVQTVSREGVVNRIQKLNRLETVAYNVDTVITSEKQGTWYRLWQDGQKGLFIARGRVVAGVDLSKLGDEMVQITDPSQAQIEEAIQQATASGNEKGTITILPNIMVTLPPSEVFAVYLDNIEVYDWQAGVLGMREVDPEILKQAQLAAKREVLERACRGDMMKQAEENATTQVQQLFALTGAKVTVTSQGVGACQVLQ